MAGGGMILAEDRSRIGRRGAGEPVRVGEPYGGRVPHRSALTAAAALLAIDQIAIRLLHLIA